MQCAVNMIYIWVSEFHLPIININRHTFIEVNFRNSVNRRISIRVKSDMNILLIDVADGGATVSVSGKRQFVGFVSHRGKYLGSNLNRIW
jgi:hypothetical protein